MKRPTEQLQDWLKERSALSDAKALEPLPTTRALGEKFGISHGTAFRILCAFEEDGRVWRHENGRFYPALAGRVLGRQKPLAVILRRMSSWSSLCRELMEGFTDECGDRDRPVLLFHNKNLLVQNTPSSDAKIASVDAQREFLRDFFLLQGDAISGVLLDEIWADEATTGIFPSTVPVVNFYRSTVNGGQGSIGADFAAGALLAMSHLLAAGYEKIFLLNPLPSYQPARLFIKAAHEVYQGIAGRPFPAAQEVALHDPERYRAFVRKLSKSKKRFGLICPEDNFSLHFLRDLRARGIAVGRRHGLLSVMGTPSAMAAGLTCVRYDYQEMGRRAARMLCSRGLKHDLLDPQLLVGETTQP